MQSIDFTEIAKENFDNWNGCLKKKDPSIMADFYHKDATFLPTVSGEFKKGQSGAKEYFSHFLLKNPEGKIVDQKVQSISQQAYLHSGMYDFEVGDNNDRHIVKARFSFVWVKDDNVWKILHHHSSLKPNS